MTAYVALLRGIMPQNPSMRNEKLCAVFESLGYTNVQSVIASGNIIFESNIKDVKKLEAAIEKALLKHLGIKITTIVRSKKEIESLIAKNPFKGVKDAKPLYLVITFFKKGGSKATAIDMSNGTTPDFMRTIEKEFGKEITTRTWKTVGRLAAKFETYS